MSFAHGRGYSGLFRFTKGGPVCKSVRDGLMAVGRGEGDGAVAGLIGNSALHWVLSYFEAPLNWLLLGSGVALIGAH